VHKLITFTSNGNSVSADWYESANGPYSIVIVAYGTEGMNDPFDELIHKYCEGLLGAGFSVLRPDYFQATKTTPGMAGVFASGPSNRFDVWVETIQDAVKEAATLAGAKYSGKLGLVGFSLGANLVLRTAAAMSSKPNALIDFFGPIGSISETQISSPIPRDFPPVQIHHGELDGIVPMSESDLLESWLKSVSVHCEYDKRAHRTAGHPGQRKARVLMKHLPDADWESSDQRDSLVSSVTFLKKHL
jgi:dienelactone hydrolase